MVFSSTAPLCQLFLIRTMFIQVIEQIAQTILSQSDTSFLGAFPQDRDHPMLAVEIPNTQIGQLRNANPRVIQEPQNSTVAHRSSFSNGAVFIGRGTCVQELFKLFGCNGLNQGLADLGKHNAIKGVGCQGSTMDQPVKEGAGRTSVGVNRSLATDLAMSTWRLAQMGEPGTDVSALHVIDLGDLKHLFKIGPHEPECCLMPFHGLGTRVASLMVLHILINQCGKRSTAGLQILPCRLPFRHLTSDGLLLFRLACLSLGIKLDPLGSCPCLRDAGCSLVGSTS